MDADELLRRVRVAELDQCRDSSGAPLLTLLDFRNENFLSKDDPPPRIKTLCNTLFMKLDDLRQPDVRKGIPQKGPVVTVTETGNRDGFAIRYLSAHGYSNIKALRFGMRGWLKSRYPIE